MKHIVSLLLLSLLIASSCMANEIDDSSKRINIAYGLSVLPPQENGWKVFHKSEFQLVLGKNGPTKGSSYIANVKLFKLPSFETEQQFVKYISEGKKAQRPVERFKVIQNKEEIISGGTNHIIKYHSIAEDKVASAKYGNITMLLEVFGYTFQHPENHSIGVEIGYSYRYHIGKEDKAFEEKANAFLDQIKITDF